MLFKKFLSKTYLFQKVFAGEAKESGRVKTESSRVKNILYHLILGRKAWDTSPGGWVGAAGSAYAVNCDYIA